MNNELLPGMLDHSARLILDFESITADIPPERDIRTYFKEYIDNKKNPRLPANRQAINNAILEATNSRYLVSGYTENRRQMLIDTVIAREGRTFHLGIDIFARDLETVYAPCNGQVIAGGYEEGFGTFGHYVVFKPENTSDYIYLGHLSRDLPRLQSFAAGEPIAILGDYVDNENGGWSRHLHVQLISAYEEGMEPIGYSSEQNLYINRQLYPDPMTLYPDWSML